ncbi:PPE family protein [[Mycobacterium] zoologicum]|uniref:PPE family protein n=1 Tax=[Mycobacterium] zoologicum TaxID=2872311 RepID=UPI002B81408A|nr:PPE family protein [Mycolicibacter sp. MYC101]MEB3062075.1 PPE family protein [Mycolicibacter sp. MYC101]
MTGFAVLPPEVNSARMYSGAGSAPLLAAAAGWDRLAAALTSAADSYRSVTVSLTDGPWQGGSAVAMSAAAQPFSAWLDATAAQAAVTAGQARVAAAAYEAAFAATVPPPVIAANRAALSSLVSGNILGQNTAAIAANQADYEQMWAQDVVAMQTYAAGSAAATPDSGALSAAPQTTNPTGSQAGTAAPAAGTASNALADLLNNDNPIQDFLDSDAVQAFNTLFPVLDPFYGTLGLSIPTPLAEAALSASGFAAIPGISGFQTFLGATGAVPVFAASAVSEGGKQFTLASSPGPALNASGAESGRVSAGMGRATAVGGFSAPPAWPAAPAGAVRLASATASSAGALGGGMAAPGGWLGGIPPMGGIAGAPSVGAPGVRTDNATVIPQLAREGGGGERARQQSALGAEDAAAGLSERELRELEQLRRAVAESMERRDAAARSIREAIR